MGMVRIARNMYGHILILFYGIVLTPVLSWSSCNKQFHNYSNYEFKHGDEAN